jgi:hypothetical protein
MSKTPETLDIERRLLRYTHGQFGCDEVTIGPFGRERVDFITLDFKGTWRCFEIKVSKADFHSKARKTFIGHLNYFVMPRALFAEVGDEVPSHVGVLVPGGNWLISEKKAERRPLGCDEKVLTRSIIRSLYRTYEQVKMSGNETVVGEYRRRIERLESTINDEKRRGTDAWLETSQMKSFLRQRGLLPEYEGWIARREERS